MSNVITTTMTEARRIIEDETQRRGQAFLQARQELEREYNCTVTIIPKWVPGVSPTWALAFDEQVMVGPAPDEEETSETQK